jgi:pimeloyl-ACP methyl ester carboxylesterase
MLARQRAATLVRDPRYSRWATRCAEGAPERAGKMGHRAPLKRLCVLGCTLVTIAFAGSACSLTSAPSHTHTSAPTPLAAATSVPPPTAPYCGVISGRHRYLASTPDRTAVLVLGTGPRGIVLGGQANGGICQVLPVAEQFATRGYHVAVFDWNTNYAADMTAATQALLADGAHKVVLGGFSRGALVALGVAPALGPMIVGVISISGGPSPSEGFPTIASLAAFPGPILLVSSADDPVFPHGTSAAIAVAHHGPTSLLVVPGYEHALELLDGPYSQRINTAIDAFLTRLLWT